jgi:hypothetical protein
MEKRTNAAAGPGRNAKQALVVLANSGSTVLGLNQMVVTLIAFDLKRGVSIESTRLAWTPAYIFKESHLWSGNGSRSFREVRSASMKFDDFETAMEPLENTGLAQGSPLSPDPLDTL